MTTITHEQFRRSFFERHFFQTVSKAKRSASIQACALIAEKIKAIPVGTFGGKYRSKVHNFGVTLAFTDFILKVTPIDGTQQLFTIYINQLPTLEQLIRHFPKKTVIHGRGYKLDEVDNSSTLERILQVCQVLQKDVEQIREQSLVAVMDEYQAAFDASSDIKFDEVSNVYFNYSREAFRDLFVKHEFINVPALEQFPESSHCEHVDAISAYPMTGWEQSRRPDGYGHECGSSFDILWEAKKLSLYGWSSDD